jgi:hypothetical protein
MVINADKSFKNDSDYFFLSSRNILIAPHCNPCDPNCVDVLTIAYNTLLSSALKTWSPKHTLSPSAFVAFIQSVLEGLPSSSSNSPSSLNVSTFGEVLVDIIWSVDAELEEIIAEAKVALINCGDQNGACGKMKDKEPQLINVFFSYLFKRNEGEGKR